MLFGDCEEEDDMAGDYILKFEILFIVYLPHLYGAHSDVKVSLIVLSSCLYTV